VAIYSRVVQLQHSRGGITGYTSTHVDILSHARFAVGELIGDLPRGQPALVEQGGHRLAVGVAGQPVEPTLSRARANACAVSVAQSFLNGVDGVVFGAPSAREPAAFSVPVADVGASLPRILGQPVGVDVAVVSHAQGRPTHAADFFPLSLAVWWDRSGMTTASRGEHAAVTCSG